MGGRGGKSGFSYKKQLREMAKQGKMPRAIMGAPDVQAKIFKYIDKIYPMPQTDNRTTNIVDQGAGVWVNAKGRVSRSSYPSGEAASEAEKRGVLKWLLHNHLNR